MKKFKTTFIRIKLNTSIYFAQYLRTLKIKILQRIILIRKYTWLISLLFLFSLVAKAQSLYVIDRLSCYKKIVYKEPQAQMVELKKIVPGIVYDLRYATKNNFVGKMMYRLGTHQTFLRKPAAIALAKSQKILNAKGIGFKVYDAYRPYAVSKKFWKLVQDERYVANPARGSHHNRGTAIDITLIDLNTGRELDMGTDFDNFTDTAHHSFKDLAPQILNNRQLLKSTMEANGFKALDSEWWHYTYQTDIKFDVLDISFKKLGK